MLDIGDLPKAIQLALAPAFLLTGIGALLNVMTGRLARIVDRARAFAEGKVRCVSADHASIALERQALEPRRRLTSFAINATTIAALLVCVVIAGLFVEVLLQVQLRWLMSAVFAAAMFALLIGVAFFLCEVHVAMRTVRIAVGNDRANYEIRTERRPFADHSRVVVSYPARRSRRRSMHTLSNE